MDMTILIICLIIWSVVAFLATLMTFLSNKLKIKDKYLSAIWDIFKYVTGGLFGALLGSLTGGTNA